MDEEVELLFKSKDRLKGHSMHMISELSDRLKRSSCISEREERMFSKRDLMNLESLFLLSAIAQYKGKRKASGVLNTSVDTINKYIDNLEQDLGTKLLTSNGRGSNLTPSGYRLLENAEKIKSVLDDLYKVTPPKGEMKGEVRVGMSVGVNANLFPRNIGDFFDAYPNIEIVSLSALDSSNLNDLSLDVGISLEMPNKSDIVMISQIKVPYGFFAAPEYLAKYGYPLDLNDLLERYRVVNLISTAARSKSWKEMLKKAKHLCYSTNNSFSLIEVIKNGLGIGLLPQRFKDEGLVCLDNIECDYTVTYYLFSYKKTKDIPRVRAVINYYRELLEACV